MTLSSGEWKTMARESRVTASFSGSGRYPGGIQGCAVTSSGGTYRLPDQRRKRSENWEWVFWSVFFDGNQGRLAWPCSRAFLSVGAEGLAGFTMRPEAETIGGPPPVGGSGGSLLR